MELRIFKDGIFKDNRGFYWTSFDKGTFPKKLNFNHDKFSISKKNVLRGLHGDNKTWKLISCVFGKVYFVVVNYNKSSNNYLKYKSIILSHKKNSQILIPPNFLNGFLCLSKNCVIHYKLSYKGQYCDAKNQYSVNWNDNRIAIKWPRTRNLILSERDKNILKK
jgi:dTDP-4-dehydrorhamnose 3,5-epimerase